MHEIKIYFFTFGSLIFDVVNISLENDQLEIAIKPKGAELCSVLSKETNLQYMWSGDAAFWGKTSPILFPIVGALKDGTFYYKDKAYALPRHGFARDQIFEVRQTRETAVFTLRSNKALLETYPFDFELKLSYSLVRNALHVGYEVSNIGKEDMFFSIGAHPAFSVPMVTGTSYEDYYLLFSEKENAGRWPIDNAGLITQAPIALLNNSNRLDLTKILFENDALVFKHLESKKISLRSDQHSHGLNFYFEGFPFMGIWAAKNADFICIEPWCGIADGVDHDQQLSKKEGIEKLGVGKSWSKTWIVEFF